MLLLNEGSVTGLRCEFWISGFSHLGHNPARATRAEPSPGVTILITMRRNRAPRHRLRFSSPRSQRRRRGGGARGRRARAGESDEKPFRIKPAFDPSRAFTSTVVTCADRLGCHVTHTVVLVSITRVGNRLCLAGDIENENDKSFAHGARARQRPRYSRVTFAFSKLAERDTLRSKQRI